MKFLLRHRWLQVVLYGLAHFAAANISQYLSFRPDGFVPFWLPSGLYVGTLLRVETKRWPGFMMAACAANLTFDLTQGQPLLTALIFTAGNFAEAVVCAGMMRRFVSRRPTLTTLQEVVNLALLATLSCALSATLGAAALGHKVLVTSWSNWWSGDVLAILLVSPLILRAGKRRRSFYSSKSISTTERAAFGICLIATTWIVFFMEPDALFPRNSLLVLFVLWSGLRFGARVTSLIVLGISLVAVYGTSHSMGSNLGPVAISITQTFLATLAMSGLITTAILTERRRAEEALRTTLVDLARISRVATMGEMVASIAHEINQPLTTVVTNADACRRMLLQRVPDLAELEEAISDIGEAGKRAGAVVSGIRTLLRKESPENTELLIGEVIGEALDFVRAEINRKRISVEQEVGTRLRVNGNRVQLQQVMLNLILNSIEAITPIKKGPRVLRITVESNSAGGVLVAVRDSGVGLDREDIAHIFDPFYTTKPDGLGMGLKISRSIIEAHGGRLWATPNGDGPGTTLRFTLLGAPCLTS